LFFNDASQEEVLLLVNVVTNFCYKKGITISRGRPKGETKNVTVSSEFYQQILEVLKEEIKSEEDPPKRITQSKLKFQQTNDGARNFNATMELIESNLKALKDIAYKEKRLSRLPIIYEED